MWIELLSGGVLPLLLLCAGAVFLVSLLPCIARRRDRSPHRERGGAVALAVALAGTLGVGNIAGVASAIALGGPGAVFWLWLSSVFAMVLKYAEAVLAVRYRRYDARGNPFGGAPYYMRKAFGRRAGRCVGAVFAALCCICSLTLGGVMQSAAAAEALDGAFSIPPIAVGIGLGLAALLILWRGARGVERACALLVPFVCVAFSLASVLAILRGRAMLPAVLSQILSGAFRAQSGAAGVLGFFTSRAVRYGVARGLVSNEAGCGTATFAHAAARTTSAVRQGLWGIVEVFVDTVLLCTLTAFVLLLSGESVTSGGGMRYALCAYRALLGPVAVPFLALAVLLFAFATVLCWSHYGTESLRVLVGSHRYDRLLLCFVPVSCVLGAVAAPELAWGITDLVLGAMAVLNIVTLLVLRKAVVKETKGE